MNRKLLLIAAGITILVALLMSTGDALAGGQSDQRYFCQAWANDPYKYGSEVRGTGGATCTTTMSQIYVVVQLKDSYGRNDWDYNTCYNTNSCTATASLSYVSNRQWQTRTSGYIGDFWEGYFETDWKDL